MSIEDYQLRTVRTEPAIKALYVLLFKKKQLLITMLNYFCQKKVITKFRILLYAIIYQMTNLMNFNYKTDENSSDYSGDIPTKNITQCAKEPSFSKMIKYLLHEDSSEIPKNEILDEVLPILTPNMNLSGGTETSYTWIGHSTIYLVIDGIRILTDPIFSDRASFCQMIGPKRYRKAAISVDDLPQLDIVLISHGHYDHLDLPSVKELNDKFGTKVHWLIPKGLKYLFDNVGCANVEEFTWWEFLFIKQVKFVFTPVKHMSRRGIFEKKILPGSWCILGSLDKIFFCGDTAYSDCFKLIGDKYGPFNLAAIPIGAYEPRSVFKDFHIDPSEAIKIHRDIRSMKSVAIHWGTFNLSKEFYLEPKMKIEEMRRLEKPKPINFCTISHGETILA